MVRGCALAFAVSNHGTNHAYYRKDWATRLLEERAACIAVHEPPEAACKPCASLQDGRLHPQSWIILQAAWLFTHHTASHPEHGPPILTSAVLFRLSGEVHRDDAGPFIKDQYY